YMTNDPIYKQDPLEYFALLNDTRSPGYITKVADLYYQKALGNLTQSDIDSQLSVLRKRDYREEYMDRFAKSSFSQDYNLSISQGSEFAQTYFSARFQDNRPNSIDATSNRVAMNLNNSFNFAKWVKLTSGISMNIDNSKNKNLSYIGATTFMPYDQIIGDDGQRATLYPFNMYRSQEIAENESYQQMGYNVYDDLESGSWAKNKDIYLKFLANAEFKIVKDLTFDLRFQYEHITGKSENYSSADSYQMRELVNRYTSVYNNGYYDEVTYHLPQGGKLSESDKQLQNMNLRGQFNYSSVFNEKHAFSALAGFEMRENKIRYIAQDRYGYDDQLLSYQYVDWASLSKNGVLGLLSDVTQKLSPDMGVGEAIHRYVSGYFNAGYTYDSRYSGTVSVRVDQADLFGTDPKYRYRPLWSVGASWNVNNEAFMQPYSWVDMLKLRFSYGITGNVDQNSTPFLIGSMMVSPETGGSITDVFTPPNKLLRWEKTSTLNFGLDFAAMNRLNGSVDVYKRYSSDLLAPKRYDPSMGFPQGRVNNGAMSNKGIELSGSYDWIKTRDWKFTSQLTAAYNKNEIEKIDYEPTNALDLLGNPNGYYLTGTSRGTMYAYKYGGLNDVGDPIVFDENGNPISNDPVRSIDAVYAVGQLTPKWQGMLNLS
ncbi:MAG: TonB-dependent receptor domain-containing protein, partial [Bacteroidales bacterium]